MVADAGADGLDQEAHRLARDGGEALGAQHVRPGAEARDAGGELGRGGELRQVEDHAVEVVVVMAFLGVVPGRAVGDIVLRGEAEAEQHRRVDAAPGAGDNADGAGQGALHRGAGAGEAGLVEQVGLRQGDEVGAGELVVEDLLHRVVMVEGLVGGALGGERGEVGGDAALGQRRAIDHGDDAIDRHPAADRRPVEGLDQRLRQGEAAGLDQDVVGRRGAGEQRIHGGDEVVGDRAAEAAIGQLDDVGLVAGGDAAAAQDLGIDADIAELVDDDGEAAAAGILEQVADQRRLPGAAEAGDDGAGDAGSHAQGSRGGMRAMRPRFKGSGRPRQGITWPAAAARRRAPSCRAGAASAGSRLPKT